MKENEEKIKVSVTLIAYKHGAYIRKCLDSIFSQKVNFRYEVIIADDCSNDGTKEILEEYKNKYPDILVPIVHEKNLGASQNVMSVWPYIRGEYIALSESDDFWTDDRRLQKQVDFLDTHPEYVAIGSNYYDVDAEGKNPEPHMLKWEVNKSYSLKDYLNKGYTVHINTLMIRNVIPFHDSDFKNFYSQFPTMGDTIYFVLLYDKGNIFVLPDVMHAHRSGEGNATSFSYGQRTKAAEYCDMYRAIVNGTNNYLGNKYNLEGLIANRVGNIILLSRILRTIKVNKKVFNEFVDSLPISTRRLAYKKCFQQLFYRILRKIGKNPNLFYK